MRSASLHRLVMAVVAVWLLVGGLAFADKVDDLIKRLKDPDNKVRLSAALNLGKLGDKRAIPALTAALGDSDKTVRGVAASALGKLVDSTVDPKVRDAAIAALEKTASSDPDTFVRGQAQKSFDALKGLKGSGGGTSSSGSPLGGKLAYVEIGPISDASGSKIATLPPMAKKTIEKKLARDFTTKWPTGKSPTDAELKKAGAKGFYIEGTINKFETKTAGSTTTVKCYVSLIAATWPQKSVFAYATNKKGEVDTGNSAKEIDEAKSMCVEAMVDALVGTDFIPQLKSKI